MGEPLGRFGDVLLSEYNAGFISGSLVVAGVIAAAYGAWLLALVYITAALFVTVVCRRWGDRDG